MAGEINAKDLDQETKDKLGINKAGTDLVGTAANLPPIPPKPELTGDHFKDRKALGKYYRDNEAAIMADFKA